jgi:hydroxyacylglutathione hydrolase
LISKDLVVHRLPALQDNYIFIIENTATQEAVVVDPGESAPVVRFMRTRKLRLHGFLITHHHGDHCGGVSECARECATEFKTEARGTKAELPFYLGSATAYEKIRRTSPSCEFRGVRLWEQDEKLNPCAELWGQVIEVLFSPGHTLDHLCFYWPQQEWLFCGDVIFSLGCGRLFEGSPAQMHNSLRRLAQLPGPTQVFCAHEYTLQNLAVTEKERREHHEFDDEKNRLADFAKQVRSARERDQATVPFDLQTLLRLNLFLRAENLEQWTRIRERRNHFSL